jgi:ABC-2 type transport system permease protein
VWSQKLVIMVLSGALALALWQKARDQLPYLLDPAASPPARVAASDGLIAATLFFVLRALVLVLLTLGRKGTAPPLQVLTLAFGIAGLMVYLLARLVYWRGKTQGVPAIWRRAAPAGALRRSVALGLGLGALAAVAALLYLAGLRHMPLWQDMALHAIPAAGHRAQGARIGWLFALTVVAAPLCEEFIFRGLIFGGLLRSMKPAWAMLASAAIFAIVHPPVSMLPVFVLGLCTAYAFHRGRTLLAPMLAHALYNAVVLAWQLWA